MARAVNFRFMVSSLTLVQAQVEQVGGSWQAFL